MGWQGTLKPNLAALLNFKVHFGLSRMHICSHWSQPSILDLDYRSLCGAKSRLIGYRGTLFKDALMHIACQGVVAARPHQGAHTVRRRQGDVNRGAKCDDARAGAVEGQSSSICSAV